MDLVPALCDAVFLGLSYRHVSIVTHVTLLVTLHGTHSVQKVRRLFFKRNVETKHDGIRNEMLSEYTDPVFVLRRPGVPLGWASVDCILVVFCVLHDRQEHPDGKNCLL